MLAAAVAALAGCAARDTVAAATIQTTATGGGPAYCQAASPPVLADGTCTGALAQRVFGHAVCVCGGGASLGVELATDAFDSRVGPWAAGGAGGDVGLEGGLSFNGRIHVGGNLVVSGGGVQAGASLQVDGDLDAGGPLGGGASVVNVGRDARIAGDVGVASLSVGGTLTTPAGATRTGTISAGATTTAAVSVAPPCPCGVDEAVDVAGIVAQHRSANDNGRVGLASGALALVEAPLELALPCGRYYLDRIQGSASLTVRATGRVALFVEGALTYSGPLTIALDPGAELDLFVSGPVNLPPSLTLGDPARPGALRVWLAMGGSVTVPDGALWAANLYAPNADLAARAPLQLYGAVMVLHVNGGGVPLQVHYDRAISAAAAACAP